jgi:predicted HTH domain antitoxin
MNDLTITVPGAVLAGAKLPRKGMEAALRRRLAMALFSDGILSGSSACQMAGVSKAEFQFLLGEHGIAQPLEEADLDSDAAGIAAWKAHR